MAEEEYTYEVEIDENGKVVYHKIPAQSSQKTTPSLLKDQFSLTTKGRKKWENTVALDPKSTKPFISRYGDTDEAALQWLKINFPKGMAEKK